MKTLLSLLFSTLLFTSVYSQNINWQSLDENQKHLSYLNIGYDFGFVTQIGYGHQLNTSRPILLTFDYSFPAGNIVFDDFKMRLGGQWNVFQKGNFSATTKVHGLFRRQETDFIRLANFGCEISALVGFYKPKWHIAGEFGFDKAIVTHLKHSANLQEHYPEIKDGWFIPSAGHFFYGLQGSKSIGSSFDVTVRLGITKAERKDKDPLLPVYGQMGLIWKFGKNN